MMSAETLETSRVLISRAPYMMSAETLETSRALISSAPYMMSAETGVTLRRFISSAPYMMSADVAATRAMPRPKSRSVGEALIEESLVEVRVIIATSFELK